MERKHYCKVAIIGGGPAGLTAALYLGRAQVDTLVIDADMCGGQIISSPLLENVPGYYGSGADLAVNILDEVSKYSSVQFANFSKVVYVDYSFDDYITIGFENGDQVRAEYVICATGANPIRLPQLESENTHYCVTCDGALYQDKVVAVIGGGNSALQYALELTKYAKQIYVCTNEPFLRGEENAREKVLNNEKIEVRHNFTAKSFDGDVLTPENGHSIMVDGIFVAIGYRPSTDYLNVEKHNGYFVAGADFTIYSGETWIPHLYAIGDCRLKPFNQVVIAMSEGCQVALQIIRDLEN